MGNWVLVERLVCICTCAPCLLRVSHSHTHTCTHMVGLPSWRKVYLTVSVSWPLDLNHGTLFPSRLRRLAHHTPLVPHLCPTHCSHASAILPQIQVLDGYNPSLNTLSQPLHKSQHRKLTKSKPTPRSPLPELLINPVINPLYPDGVILGSTG